MTITRGKLLGVSYYVLASPLGPISHAVLVLTLFKIYLFDQGNRGTGLRWYSRFFKSASLDLKVDYRLLVQV